MNDLAPGWDAITAHFARAYPGQEPQHYGTAISHMLGGPPLDGISVYRASDPVWHWHYVTYGYSDLYENTAPADEDSGYGIEMTFRLADPAAADPGATAPVWALNLLQNMAQYVFDTGNVIYAHHHMDANGPIALEENTVLTALACTDDPVGTPIDTPNGTVRFVQAVGITAAELAMVSSWNTEGVLDVIGRRWPHGITILDRPGLDSDPGLVQAVDEGRARDGSSMTSLFLDTLALTAAGDDVVCTLNIHAPGRVAQALGALFDRTGRAPDDDTSFLLAGRTTSVQIVAETGTPVRRLPTDTTPGLLSLTPAAIGALAGLPAEPGDHRLGETPGILWRLSTQQ
ncbi:MAG: suppressor of fused domain protein [Micrococcales bacterium]|nr:suppressor of fused domain protein [Micrococcales bacterium]